jgi:hypothetical protein
MVFMLCKLQSLFNERRIDGARLQTGAIGPRMPDAKSRCIIDETEFSRKCSWAVSANESDLCTMDVVILSFAMHLAWSGHALADV